MSKQNCEHCGHLVEDIDDCDFCDLIYEQRRVESLDAEIASLRAQLTSKSCAIGDYTSGVQEIAAALGLPEDPHTPTATIVGAIDALRSQLAEVTRERDEARSRIAVPAEVRRAIRSSLFSQSRFDVSEEPAIRAWLASLDVQPKDDDQMFCACGRRTSECDRSRKACVSRANGGDR